MGRSQVSSMMNSLLAQSEHTFRRCNARDRSGRAVPVAKPKSDAEARALKELGVCNEGGTLTRYIDTKRAITSFAGFKAIQQGTIGRELARNEDGVMQVGERHVIQAGEPADDRGDVWDRYKWYIIGGGSALVLAAAAAVWLWRRGRGGDGGGTDYHDDGRNITIRKGGKVKHTLEEERAEVFRQCCAGKIFSEIVKNVQTKFGEEKTDAHIKGLLASFEKNGWIETSMDEASGNDKYTVIIRERSTNGTASGGFSYKITDGAFVLKDKTTSRSYSGWQRDVLEMLTRGNMTIDQIHQAHPYEKKVIKRFLSELQGMGAVTYVKREKAYRIKAFEDTQSKDDAAPPPAPESSAPPAPATPAHAASPPAASSVELSPSMRRDIAAAPQVQAAAPQIDAGQDPVAAGTIDAPPPPPQPTNEQVIARFMNPANIHRSLFEGLSQQAWEDYASAILAKEFGAMEESQIDSQLSQRAPGSSIDVGTLAFTTAPRKSDGSVVTAADILQVLSLGVRLNHNDALNAALLWSIKETGWNDAARSFDDYSNFYASLASLTMGAQFTRTMQPSFDRHFVNLLDRTEFQIQNRFINEIELFGEPMMRDALLAHMGAYLKAAGAAVSAKMIKKFLPPQGVPASSDLGLLLRLPLMSELQGRNVERSYMGALRDVVLALDIVLEARIHDDVDTAVGMLMTSRVALSEAKTVIDGLIEAHQIPARNLSDYMADAMTYIAEDIKNHGAVMVPASNAGTQPPPVPQAGAGSAPPVMPPVPQAGAEASEDEELGLSRTDLEPADPSDTVHHALRLQGELRERAADPGATQGMSRGQIETYAQKSVPPFSTEGASDPSATAQWSRTVPGKKGSGTGGKGGPPPVPNGDGNKGTPPPVSSGDDNMGGPPPNPGQSTRVFDDRVFGAPAWRIDMAAGLAGMPLAPGMGMPLGMSALQMGAVPLMKR